MTTTLDSPSTTRSARARAATLALGLSLALAAPTLADPAPPAPLADTWRVGDLHGERRVLAGDDGALSVTIDWPGRGPKGLRGALVGESLVLTVDESEGRGMSGVLRGEAARHEVVRRTLTGRVERGPDGDAIAVQLLEDGEVVGRERWVRPGPAALEIERVLPEGSYHAKDGLLRVLFRVKNRPIRVRLRIEVSGDTAYHFYEPLVPAQRRLPGRRIALVEREEGTLEPGEHDLTWDGRDDTAAKRIALGGPCKVVLEDALAPETVRAERSLIVAMPVVRYIGPKWPVETDPFTGAETGGRDRAKAAALARDGFERLGFRSDRPHSDVAYELGVIDALEKSACVVVATHGGVGALALYAGSDDESFDPAHRQILSVADLDPSTHSFKDLRVVVLWACSAGSGSRQAAPDPQKDAEFVGLPARLRQCGADIVVAFTRKILSAGHEDFLERLLERLLQDRSIGDASREAADYADARSWGTRHEAWRPMGLLPLREALTIFPPDTQTDRERLDPACWGISTN